MFGRMKRIFSFLALLPALVIPALAQDAATQERLDKLTGQIEDLVAGQKSQQRQLAEIVREIGRLSEQTSRPPERYATPEDLNRLRDAIKEVDRKRIEDAEKIQREIANLGKVLASTPPKKNVPAANADAGSTKPSTPERFFEHTVARGDTISSIVQAYRDQNVKVTLDQVLKANPTLKPERLQPGQKIVIPAP
jgi:LysM repeat protein